MYLARKTRNLYSSSLRFVSVSQVSTCVSFLSFSIALLIPNSFHLVLIAFSTLRLLSISPPRFTSFQLFPFVAVTQLQRILSLPLVLYSFRHRSSFKLLYFVYLPSTSFPSLRAVRSTSLLVYPSSQLEQSSLYSLIPSLRRLQCVLTPQTRTTRISTVVLPVLQLLSPRFSLFVLV